MRRFLPILALGALLAGPAAAQTSAQVQRAIDRGITYLKSSQRPDGSWPYGHYTAGGTALATYAMLLAGVPETDHALARAIRYLRSQPLRYTYSVGLQALALAEADPQAHLLRIKACSDWLLAAQLDNGMWSYQQRGRGGVGDNSNTQFAILGLWAAERAGIAIDAAVWKKITDYWHTTQDGNGGWSYRGTAREAPRFSMTAAGVGSLLIANHQFLQPGEDCGEILVDKSVLGGLAWLEANTRGRVPANLYDLYALERVGMLSNQSIVAGVDWYPEGCQQLLRGQRADGSWTQYTREVGTALALLFLAKGRAPLVVSKLRLGADEESRVGEVEKLVGFASALFGRKMTWQSVEWDTPVQRMLIAPILFLNHHEEIDFTEGQIQTLRRYVDNGGTLVANSCCEEFDASFRGAMERAFPGRGMNRLADAHPLYSIEYAINERKHRFLEGISWNCRLSVIYSPKDLSYGWSTGRDRKGLPGDTALQIGINILRYLVDRGQNLDRLRQVVLKEGGRIEGGERAAIPTGAFVPGLVVHGGDFNPDPPVGQIFLERLRDRLPVRTSSDWVPVTLDSKDLFNHPFLILKGHQSFEFVQAEVDRLEKHLEAGGFLYMECCCGSEDFDASARALVGHLFDDRELAPIPAEHELWRAWDRPLGDVEFTPLAGRPPGPPPFEGVELADRLAVVYSPLAVGCAIADHDRTQCCGIADEETALAIYERLVAYALGR